MVSERDNQGGPDAAISGGRSNHADGYLDFNAHPVNVAMVNAIKELASENERLRTENKILQQKIKRIEELLGI